MGDHYQKQNKPSHSATPPRHPLAHGTYTKLDARFVDTEQGRGVTICSWIQGHSDAITKVDMYSYSVLDDMTSDGPRRGWAESRKSLSGLCFAQAMLE